MNEIKDAIEERVPGFLWYVVIDDPFNPRVEFRFGDYYMAVALPKNGDMSGFCHHLNAVADKLEGGLPDDYAVVWRYLLTGESDATLYNISRGISEKLDVALDDGNSESREYNLVYFPLRGEPMWAAYVADLNILAIGRNE